MYHITHTHSQQPVTGLPVKQSEHEGPEDLAAGAGVNRERRNAGFQRGMREEGDGGKIRGRVKKT